MKLIKAAKLQNGKRMTLNKIFRILGARREDCYRYKTKGAWGGKVPGRITSTTIYTDQTREDLEFELRRLWLESAKRYYPVRQTDDGSQMAQLNALYDHGLKIIDHHFGGKL